MERLLLDRNFLTEFKRATEEKWSQKSINFNPAYAGIRAFLRTR
jgi:hypothetical protein